MADQPPSPLQAGPPRAGPGPLLSGLEIVCIWSASIALQGDQEFVVLEGEEGGPGRHRLVVLRCVQESVRALFLTSFPLSYIFPLFRQETGEPRFDFFLS